MPPEEKKRLDIVTEVKRLKELYATKGREKFNALVYGQKGSGKTGIREAIAAGDIIADTTWENEDPLNPKAWDGWNKAFRERVAGGFFKHFATYGVDSFTLMSVAAMNSVLKSKGREGGI